tara:strand:- start:570 stop:1373 length:804 start_codon:yes stop_codon:yes gene_type:complete
MAQDPIVDGKGNYEIDDGTGAQVRARINTTLQAIATNNSGSEAPPANNHQWFANTNTNKLCYKDASTGNNALTNYFNLANLDGGLFVDQTSTFNGDVIFQGTNGTTNITFDPSLVLGNGGFKFKDFATIRLGTDDDFVISHFQGVNLFASGTEKQTFMVTRTSNSALPCYTLRTEDSSDADDAYQAFVNGHQELHFNGTEKFRTSASGITVTGSVTTQDINMSNLNSLPNEVDNTQGSWSIQEGSDDLFLINRINGKKYKFNLTEVS